MFIFRIPSLVFILVLSLSSCKKEQSPKPRGYFRITFPDKVYVPMNKPLSYDFLVPGYAFITPDLLSPDQKEWVTVEIPGNHAQIHISYKKIDHNLPQLIEESRSLVYKHAQKASSIEEQVFINRGKRTFGTLYTLKGNAASPMQFYLTDSVTHFIRGALYIKEVPNYDSLRPVIQFLSQDVIKMIESTEWKKSNGN
ncbi:MAG TPA: gliding motility lipoprotein GldD [Prolixibacteraceae bacterium]